MEDIICSGCSLLCDDVTAEIDNGEVRSLGLCLLGFTQLDVALKQQITQSTDDLIEQAAELLTSSENPLVYGGSYLSNEAIEETLALVETLGGHFDSGASLGVLQAMTHDIHSLKLDVDLEYVRNNGEFIIYWGSDPAESVHRHPSRFAVLPRGDKIPEGVEGRTIGVVDVRETETMKMANHRMIIPIGTDVEFLETVTAELEGKSSISKSVLGIPAAEVIGFVSGFNKVDCVVIFYGSGILNSGNTEEKLSALSQLIGAIRASGKEAYALPMYSETNQMGVVKSTKTIQNALQKIVANEFTTTLVIGEDPLANLPRSAAHALARTKIVYIGPPEGLTERMASVSIHTTDMSIQGSESMTRIDQVEIEFKPWKGSKDTNTMSEVLTKLHKLVKKKT